MTRTPMFALVGNAKGRERELSNLLNAVRLVRTSPGGFVETFSSIGGIASYG